MELDRRIFWKLVRTTSNRKLRPGNVFLTSLPLWSLWLSHHTSLTCFIWSITHTLQGFFLNIRQRKVNYSPCLDDLIFNIWLLNQADTWNSLWLFSINRPFVVFNNFINVLFVKQEQHFSFFLVKFDHLPFLQIPFKFLWPLLEQIQADDHNVANQNYANAAAQGVTNGVSCVRVTYEVCQAEQVVIKH